MKIRRLLGLGAVTVIVSIAIARVLHPEYWRQEPFAPINGEAVTEAIQHYCQVSAERHTQLPELITLGQLVDAGYLSATNLGSTMAREYSVPIRGLADGTAPFTILHSPHTP